jgi:hypothetical protein
MIFAHECTFKSGVLQHDKRIARPCRKKIKELCTWERPTFHHRWSSDYASCCSSPYSDLSLLSTYLAILPDLASCLYCLYFLSANLVLTSQSHNSGAQHPPRTDHAQASAPQYCSSACAPARPCRSWRAAGQSTRARRCARACCRLTSVGAAAGSARARRGARVRGSGGGVAGRWQRRRRRLPRR